MWLFLRCSFFHPHGLTWYATCDKYLLMDLCRKVPMLNDGHCNVKCGSCGNGGGGVLSHPAGLPSSLDGMRLHEGPWEVSAHSLPRTLHNTANTFMHVSFYYYYYFYNYFWRYYNWKSHTWVLRTTLVGANWISFHSLYKNTSCSIGLRKAGSCARPQCSAVYSNIPVVKKPGCGPVCSSTNQKQIKWAVKSQTKKSLKPVVSWITCFLV